MTGLWPGPPPTFSGLKVLSGWHKKAGFRMYPHSPFCRNLPWFKSICSPGVWKFRATGENKTSVWRACRPPETMSISLPTGGASVGEQLVTVLYFTFCLLLLKIEHIKKCSHQFDSLHSTSPEGYSWRNGGAGLRGRSCSSGDCCDEQNTPLNLENKKSSTHFALSLCSWIRYSQNRNFSTQILSLYKLLHLDCSTQFCAQVSIFRFCLLGAQA